LYSRVELCTQNGIIQPLNQSWVSSLSWVKQTDGQTDRHTQREREREGGRERESRVVVDRRGAHKDMAIAGNLVAIL